MKNPSSVKDSLLRQSGAKGVVHKGNGVQVIYGPHVSVIKSNLEVYMDHAEDSGEKNITFFSPLNGKIVKLENVDDEVFSSKTLGDGIAIEPSDGRLYAPCDATVESIFDTMHAINLVSEDGCEILLHIGLDTVKLKGKFFKSHVSEGHKVKKGDLLISFDIDGIKKAGYKTTVPMIVCNSDDYSLIKCTASDKIKAGEKVIEIKE